MPLENTTSIVFSVKSDNNVRLIFTGDARSLRPAYELIIGRQGNTQSRYTTSLAKAYTQSTYFTIETPSILNPSELVTFWASWKQDLSFGKGQIIGRDTMIKTSLSALVEVRYIGIRTLSGDNDTWIFPSGNTKEQKQSQN